MVGLFFPRRLSTTSILQIASFSGRDPLLFLLGAEPFREIWAGPSATGGKVFFFQNPHPCFDPFFVFLFARVLYEPGAVTGRAPLPTPLLPGFSVLNFAIWSAFQGHLLVFFFLVCFWGFFFFFFFFFVFFFFFLSSFFLNPPSPFGLRQAFFFPFFFALAFPGLLEPTAFPPITFARRK